jgi:tRNA1(Val) A37 N6-methylase TrmN6
MTIPEVPAVTSRSVSGSRSGSVWVTGQQTPAVQRRGRYVPESMAHPAKMLPAVAAHAIATYTRPGELVLDPMCGIGTTLTEALHQDRRAIGVEYETRWAEIARTNIHHTGPVRRGAGTVYTGDARHLDWILPHELHGQVALVVTSPPYGPSTHGRVTTGAQGVHKRHPMYGDLLDRGNLANIGHHRLLAGFTRILTLTTPYLRPGGRVVITVRPWREHAELIDLPAQIAACGRAAGLVPVERCVALLGRVTETGGFVARGSFFQRDFIRRQRARGLPLHLIAHEDVITLARPPAGSPSTIDVEAEQADPAGRSTTRLGPVDTRSSADPDR